MRVAGSRKGGSGARFGRYVTGPCQAADNAACLSGSERLSVMPAHDVDNLAMAMSLIVSTRSIALLPEYAKDFFPASVSSRLACPGNVRPRCPRTPVRPGMLR
jgi:hypothetical protein